MVGQKVEDRRVLTGREIGGGLLSPDSVRPRRRTPSGATLVSSLREGCNCFSKLAWAAIAPRKRINMADRKVEVRRVPTGRENGVGLLSPEFGPP